MAILSENNLISPEQTINMAADYRQRSGNIVTGSDLMAENFYKTLGCHDQLYQAFRAC